MRSREPSSILIPGIRRPWKSGSNTIKPYRGAFFNIRLSWTMDYRGLGTALIKSNSSRPWRKAAYVTFVNSNITPLSIGNIQISPWQDLNPGPTVGLDRVIVFGPGYILKDLILIFGFTCKKYRTVWRNICVRWFFYKMRTVWKIRIYIFSLEFWLFSSSEFLLERIW